jgi:hypothetical protein
MKQSLLDYGVVLDRVPLLYDNESAVKIANNPVQHSRTKHIDICHHFLRDHVAKGDIVLCGVRSEEQLAVLLEPVVLLFRSRHFERLTMNKLIKGSNLAR